MDAWCELCTRAFNGDTAADHLILYLEGCGNRLANGQFSVITTTLSDRDRACLESLGFAPSSDQENEWTLPGDQWSLYVDAKRNERARWHAMRHRQLQIELHTHLETIQPLPGLNDQHRLALVRGFCNRFAADARAVPFLRGIAGLCRFQLFRDRLAVWRCSEHVFTQSGPEAMVEYIKLLKGVLQLERVFTSATDKRSDDDIIIDLDTSRMPDDDDDPILMWRTNSQLSDHHLCDLLAILPPHEPSPQQFCLSDIPRPIHISASIGFYHPHLLLQWIMHLFRHCTGFIHRPDLSTVSEER